MKTVKALVAFSNGVISMEQYEVRELPTDMANDLIAAGICVEAGGGSGGGVLVVTDTDDTLDKTWQEIHDAFMVGVVRLHNTVTGNNVTVLSAQHDLRGYTVTASDGVGNYSRLYYSETTDGYPTYSE